VRLQYLSKLTSETDYATARRILGDDKIIGVSVSNESQANEAAITGCDYLGIGPVFATATKPDHDPALSPSGICSLLEHIYGLQKWGESVPTVAIGGINLQNVQRVITESDANVKSLSGVAIVSAIISAPEPKKVCETFKQLLAEPPAWRPAQQTQPHLEFGPHSASMLKFQRVFEEVWEKKPMIHHITNDVVKNFSANITLACGASPIMSEDLSEVADLAVFNGALVLNMGTAGREARPLFLEAIKCNNERGNPVVFDPVGAGATALRIEATRAILGGGYCDIIKGNEGEIRTVAGQAVQMKGVDTGDSTRADDKLEKARLVKTLAERWRNIVIMTGVTDYVSDGVHTFALSDGHMYQGLVTGTGCSLGSVIAACVALHRDQKLTAVLAAICGYNMAARLAATAEGVRGPASWAVRFVDELYKLRENFASNFDISRFEKVEV
jgi:thiamine-phosphate diphosphorylase / hydroxyethylthiazole kinase